MPGTATATKATTTPVRRTTPVKQAPKAAIVLNLMEGKSTPNKVVFTDDSDDAPVDRCYVTKAFLDTVEGQDIVEVLFRFHRGEAE